MTRFIYDQFSKDYLEELLKNYGTVKAPSEVHSETREIDVYFTPFPEVDSSFQSLGLLSKLATTPAIFEPYSNPVKIDEILDCLVKLVEVRSLLKREAKRNKTQLLNNQLPKLWIITPTASTNIISGFNGTLKNDSLPGIYYLGKHLRAAIIVIHQLPCTQETLWIRMLARGKVQQQAIDELAALPANNPFRKITLELCYNLQKTLRTNQESEDREVIMRLTPFYQQDIALAVEEGKIAEGIKLIIRLLNRRIGEISPLLIAQIQKLPIEQIESLGEALLDFSKLDDLETWLNQNQES